MEPMAILAPSSTLMWRHNVAKSPPSCEQDSIATKQANSKRRCGKVKIAGVMLFFGQKSG